MKQKLELSAYMKCFVEVEQEALKFGNSGPLLCFKFFLAVGKALKGGARKAFNVIS